MRKFSWNFCTFLVSNFFWSLGLTAFFLVYNLRLLELGLNEAAIGRIASAFTVGSLAVTFLTGRLLNRYGEIRIIQLCVLATALLLPFRSLSDSVASLVIAAFLNGASIGGWMVSGPPFLTRNTSPESRSWAFSLSYGLSIGTGILAGLLVGFGSREPSIWAADQAFTGFTVNQCLLLASSASVLLGFFALLFLQEPSPELATAQVRVSVADRTVALIKSRPFFLQLLVVLVLWSFFVGSFPPFFNVYFHKQFNQSLEGIGIIFSVSQLCQLTSVLCMPGLVAKLGRVRAIFLAQFASALVLPALIVITSVELAGLIYLSYLSLQVMAEPALENFIMDSVRPDERNTVASLRYMTLFSVQALAVLVCGFAITHFGYAFFLGAISLLGVAAAGAFYFFFQLRSPLAVNQETDFSAICHLH